MTLRILSIDPGTEQSAYVVWDGIMIYQADIIQNKWMLGGIVKLIEGVGCDTVVIEQVESYGMTIGKSTFETVFWSGRFWERAECRGMKCARLPRMAVKMHLCHNSRAKDSNIRQALIDRFGPPGTKKQKGLTYGLKADLWSAFALAVTYWDQNCDSNPCSDMDFKK